MSLTANGSYAMYAANHSRPRGANTLTNPVTQQGQVVKTGRLPRRFMATRTRTKDHVYDVPSNHTDLDVRRGDVVFVTDDGDMGSLSGSAGPYVEAWTSFAGASESEAAAARVVGVAEGPASAQPGKSVASFAIQCLGSTTIVNSSDHLIPAASCVYARAPRGKKITAITTLSKTTKILPEIFAMPPTSQFVIIGKLMNAAADQDPAIAARMFEKFGLLEMNRSPLAALLGLYDLVANGGAAEGATLLLMATPNELVIDELARVNVYRRDPPVPERAPIDFTYDRFSREEVMGILRLQAKAIFSYQQALERHYVGKAIEPSGPGDQLKILLTGL